MRKRVFLCVATVVALLAVDRSEVSAQTFEAVGVRAQGMAGAFVAVADDATSSWWNPAGLATGAYLTAVLEHGRTVEPDTPIVGRAAQRATFNDFAIGFPALGLSYYRLRISEMAGSDTTAAWAANRQDPRVGGTSVRSVAMSQFGTTIGQSLGDHLVVGSTIKLLMAGAVISAASGDPDPDLDAADALDVSRHFRSDLDLGAMANFGHVRLGLTVKNLTEPTFGTGDDALTLARQARVGLAILSVPNGVLKGWTVAADADLTTQNTVMGDVRHIAAGAEGWLANGRLGVRGGVSGNTVDDLRPAASGGVSVAVTRAIHLNASRTQGRDKSVRGWNASVSMTF
ncbi:MAG: conjugal transfer protein TraF [Vicinamibacterales bacterium]